MIGVSKIWMRQLLEKALFENQDRDDIAYNDRSCQDEKEVTDFYPWIDLGSVHAE